MCRLALQIVGWVLSQADGKFYYQNTVSDASGACDHSLIHYSFKLLSFFIIIVDLPSVQQGVPEITVLSL